MKTFFTSIVLLIVAASAFATDGKPVTYKSGDETVQGILYTPEGKGPFPALVAIHEWWGLNDWVKDQSSKLADQGLSRSRSTSTAARSPQQRTKRTRSCAASRKTAPSAICMLRWNF